MIFLVSVFAMIFVDSIFLPAFIGFQNSSLLSLFIVSMVFCLGINKRTILVGTFLAVFMEILFKHSLGSYVTSFLIVVMAIFYISKFFNLPTVGSGNNFFTALILSSAAFLANYVFYIIFNIMSGYINGNYWIIVPLRELLTPLLVSSYLLETFLLFYFIKLLTKNGKRI